MKCRRYLKASIALIIIFITPWNIFSEDLPNQVVEFRSRYSKIYEASRTLGALPLMVGSQREEAALIANILIKTNRQHLVIDFIRSTDVGLQNLAILMILENNLLITPDTSAAIVIFVALDSRPEISLLCSGLVGKLTDTYYNESLLQFGCRSRSIPCARAFMAHVLPNNRTD